MFLFLINDRKNNLPNKELSDICEKYYLDIYKYCASRLNISYAGDITNDVFELLCQKWQTLENKNYKSWLYETAENLIKNHYKKHKRMAKKETSIDESIAETATYEENFDAIFENIDDIVIEKYKEEIIKSLSEQERELFDMNYIKKLSHTQIREKLSINEKALEKRLYRLKQKIIIQIKEKLSKL